TSVMFFVVVVPAVVLPSIVSLLTFLVALFFFHCPAPTEIYTLSLHDALPISCMSMRMRPSSARRCSGTIRLKMPVETTSSGSRRSEEHTSELQSRGHLVCRLLLEKKNHSDTSTLKNGARSGRVALTPLLGRAV